ncbi:MAG: hypothetical protein AVDCRST_MAG85-3128, partial [uncultured Solirubrobacteraceae bacterium]
ASDWLPAVALRVDGGLAAALADRGAVSGDLARGLVLGDPEGVVRARLLGL